MTAIQLRAMRDELQKIAGGTLGKVLTANLTPGSGPLRKRLAQGFKGVGQTIKSQYRRHGLTGMW
jgi:hypothetical protein